MSVAILIQRIVISLLALSVVIGGVIGLIKVVPEINQICDGYADEKSRDGSRDSNS
ncbi:hypothetical protein GNF18_10350 [Ligilactobacillus pobuzihii]|uniref:hypothetical protein n=1 Tax=Ligilactobacillus pobuzihii TaxID=449659 RepID=UPI0019D105B3|nr:hypothetical protein [Ligilactobacillus pobuzihii]MBN7275541.1 hypothetical protein [Ligilactobacillus pobuzihii]